VMLWDEQSNETFLLEVMVSRKRFGDAALAHESKADRIAERVSLIRSRTQQRQRLTMLRFINPHGFDMGVVN
jgi:hypothetical protein